MFFCFQFSSKEENRKQIHVILYVFQQTYPLYLHVWFLTQSKHTSDINIPRRPCPPHILLGVMLTSEMWRMTWMTWADYHFFNNLMWQFNSAICKLLKYLCDVMSVWFRDGQIKCQKPNWKPQWQFLVLRFKWLCWTELFLVNTQLTCQNQIKVFSVSLEGQ